MKPTRRPRMQFAVLLDLCHLVQSLFLPGKLNISLLLTFPKLTTTSSKILVSWHDWTVYWWRPPSRAIERHSWYVPERKERNTKKTKPSDIARFLKRSPDTEPDQTYNRIKTWWLIYSCSQGDESHTARLLDGVAVENWKICKKFCRSPRKSADQSAFRCVRVEVQCY